ncbi:hypothetical protein WA026_023132 [Henosepilachna vigintioctopunctata]|uniref:Uncharacterized protein n=1 Tax=Henosepilachna vigintioctopunctata TaxID=420089 RepID=A0AAW1U0A5_9CUCU
MNAEITNSVSQNIESNVNVCRLCGSHDSKLIDIYSEEGLQNDIPNKIKLYIPIELSKYEEASNECCLECIATLLSWHDFIQKALDTDQRYKSEYDKLEVLPQNIESNQHGINDYTSSETGVTVADVSLENLNISNERTVPSITNGKAHEENGSMLLHSESESTVELQDMEIGFRFSQNRKLSKRQRKESVDKFSCDICDRTYKRKRFLNIHMRTEHPNVNFESSLNLMHNTVLEKSDIITDQIAEEKAYMGISEPVDTEFELMEQENPSLNKTSDIQENIQDISEPTESINVNEKPEKAVKIRRKKVEVEDRFFCDKCTKGFTRKFDLKRHMTAKHPDANLDDSFSTKKNSDMLKKCRVIEDGKTFYECDICKHRTKQSYNLVRHRVIHSGVTPYVCHICGRGFRWETALRKHIEQTHDGVKKYKCEVCQKNFGLKSARDEHMNIHSDVRPFSCDICHKSFKQKSSMYIHKLYHTDNYKYSCQLCEKKFRRSQELVHHNRLHTGNKPFVCDECGLRFRLGQDLKRHKRIHLRNDEEWVCEDFSQL